MISPRISRYAFDAVYVDLGLQDAPDRASRTHASARLLRNRFPEADVIVGGGVPVALGDVREEDVSATLPPTTK